MTYRRLSALVACGAVMLSGRVSLRTPSELRAQERPPRAAPTYGSTATAVLVDVIVRDRDGRPVTTLKPDDFEVREDGVPQVIGSFTRVARGGGIGVKVGVRDPSTTVVTAAPDAQADEPTIDKYPTVTALVFDALSADAVALCQRAALEFLPSSGAVETRVGVFITEPSVRALQRYTDNPALVRQAVQHVTATGTSLKEGQAERLAALRQRREALEVLGETTPTPQASGALGAGGGANIGQVEMQRRLVQGELRMLQAFETLDRDHRGYGTTNALFAVLQSLVELPGRKTLVFFSEGLPASPALQAHLQSVIETANRSNVTVYTVDASGLRAISGTEDTRKEIEETGKERMRQLEVGPERSDQPMTRLVERAEDLLRFDSQGGLARLAQDTGGFLVRDTNDLKRAFSRIDEDMRFHYLLTYQPTNQAFDGKFRTIAIQVKQPGVEVFARKGYRALRFAPAMPVLEYEGPAMAALDAGRLPNAFPFTTAVLSFPERTRPGLSPLVVRLKTSALTYVEDKEKDAYNAQATIVVRFRDQAGQVVQKVSQQYELTGRLHELEAAKRGEILFYREPDLSPGLYTVEAAVVDGLAGRASTRVSTLDVPRASDERFRMSSVVVVRRTERVDAANRDNANPLYVGDVLLYPDAGEPFSRTAHREMTFFYTVYPGQQGGRQLRAEVDVQRNGQSLVRLPVELSAPDKLGRIQQVARLPLAPLSAGTYELRVTVRDDTTAIERGAFFRVVE